MRVSGPKKVNYNNNNNKSRRSRVAISVVSLPDNDNVIEYMRYINIYINLTTERHITHGVMNSLFS